MQRKIYAPKVIADPVYGVFDVRAVLPMIETPEFQLLGDKRQLGLAHLIFPSATHTRKAHSLGAYHGTRELADNWIKLGFISEEEGSALAGYALYHDIGHPPFSHVTEPLCLKDNNGLSIEIMERMRGPIEASGINFELLLDIATHKNALYMGVHDKNLGMEKLDYLERDGMVTVLSRPPGVEYLRKHIYFMDGGLVIDEKVVDNAIELQNFYLKMYKNVYLRKASAIAQGMLQKMTHLMLKNGTITQEALPQFTDSELLGLLAASNDSEIATLYALFRARELFQETIAVRPSRFAETYSVAGKPIAVFGLDDEELLRIASSPALQMSNQKSLRELEGAIAEITGIPATHLLIVPLSQSYRFEIKDVRIYSETNGFSSLKERYPAHFKNSEEVAASYTTFRICTTEKYRKLLSEPARAKAVLELIKTKAL